ncbi:MAG: elongation factor, partial [Phycisphaerales bacterium]|nr:elongation factor [Phycisphaerales bacterium]
SSFSDFEKDDREHKHSVHSAVMHLDHAGRRVNLIDAPGSPDLIGHAIACLPAVETVAVVVSATAGVEVAARRMMDAAKGRNLPRAVIVNKCGTPGVDLAAVVAQVRAAFGPECLPVNLPAGGGTRVVDCLLAKEGSSDVGDVAEHHARILDQIVEVDETLMERYLGGEEPNFDALHDPFDRAMDDQHLIPVLFTDAETGAGVRELLDFVARWFPSPLEGNPRPFLTGSGPGDHDNERSFPYANDPGRPLLAHVFKVTSDPFVGKLAVFRVHQGRATGQTQAFVGHNKKPVKLGHLFHLQGKEHREAAEICAGDIGAVAKLEDLHAGDVLHDDHSLDAVHLRPLAFPEPMFGLAIAPKDRGDEQKLSVQLHKLADEDPTFRWGTDRQTHEVVIHGLGELHLRLALERLKARGIEVDAKPPKIAYRETVTASAEGHHRHKKQTGGAGQFGEVYLRVEPLADDSPQSTRSGGPGFEFADETFGGTVPAQYMPAIEKGVREMLEAGVVAGYPVRDVRVAVYDGKHHPVDSKEVAFKAAGRQAFKDAFLKAKPALLEPVMTVEVTVPEAVLGTVTGDLSGRRGRIAGTDTLPGGMAVVKALVPLSEVGQYQTQLKSATGGQGSFATTFSHYAPVPPQVQQQVVAAYHPHEAEE